MRGRWREGHCELPVAKIDGHGGKEGRKWVRTVRECISRWDIPCVNGVRREEKAETRDGRKTKH
jgi:hypothetical protein